MKEREREYREGRDRQTETETGRETGGERERQRQRESERQRHRERQRPRQHIGGQWKRFVENRCIVFRKLELKCVFVCQNGGASAPFKGCVSGQGGGLTRHIVAEACWRHRHVMQNVVRDQYRKGGRPVPCRFHC